MAIQLRPVLWNEFSPTRVFSSRVGSSSKSKMGRSVGRSEMRFDDLEILAGRPLFLTAENQRSDDMSATSQMTPTGDVPIMRAALVRVA